MIWKNFFIVLLSSATLAQCFAETELKIEVTRKADDCERVTEEKDLLYVHYTSFLENGTKIESSYDRGQPMYLPLGRGKIIKGLNDALVGMCIGEIRKITVPPHLAYGNEGYKDDNSMLVNCLRCFFFFKIKNCV
ncbi:hypothetical protein FSP39_020902 [Pinctada imbricata]|uniref:peptidylprolyl isomerase n=1 Tax=Pinctada imbricata TaxID=66713 RepID=A0AA88XDU6_PINIB|nr:hypothetical protein FSP39_020902 [Pinctada imbricata]